MNTTNNELLINYSEYSDGQDCSEYFKYQILTTGGLVERDISIDFDGFVYWIGEEIEIRLDSYSTLEDFQSAVKDESQGFKDIKIEKASTDNICTGYDDYEERLVFKMSGIRRCYDTEIDLINRLREQIPNIEDSKRRVEWLKVEEAKENYEKLLRRYNDGN